MKIAIGCDHGGINLKPVLVKYLNEKGIEFKDFGTFDTKSIDYNDLAEPVCNAVASGEFDKGILILIAIAYSVCDIICILFFCPFQTWFMKNRCCATCRIYNWDFAMMFTPFIFIPNWYTYSLLGCALILLLRWEITYKLHPERFSVSTNGCLDCSKCKEKLCQHKKQLRGFLKKYKDTFFGTRNVSDEESK